MCEIKEAAGFKVGDEVESIHPKIRHIGIIKKISDYSTTNRVTYDYLYKIGDFDRWFDESEIRHTKKLANPLNRKLYPNRIEVDGYLVRDEPKPSGD